MSSCSRSRSRQVAERSRERVPDPQGDRKQIDGQRHRTVGCAHQGEPDHPFALRRLAQDRRHLSPQLDHRPGIAAEARLPQGAGGRRTSGIRRVHGPYREAVEESIAFAGGDAGRYIGAKARICSSSPTQVRRPGRPEVLDVGCGVGETDRFLEGRFRSSWGGRHAPMAERAREQNPEAEYFGYGAGDPLPVDSQASTSASRSASCTTFRLPSGRASAEMVRATKPGGIVAIFEHNPFNPLTRRSVNNCVFDEDAVLLSRRQAPGACCDRPASTGRRPLTSSSSPGPARCASGRSARSPAPRPAPSTTWPRAQRRAPWTSPTFSIVLPVMTRRSCCPSSTAAWRRSPTGSTATAESSSSTTAAPTAAAEVTKELRSRDPRVKLVSPLAQLRPPAGVSRPGWTSPPATRS